MRGDGRSMGHGWAWRLLFQCFREHIDQMLSIGHFLEVRRVGFTEEHDCRAQNVSRRSLA